MVTQSQRDRFLNRIVPIDLDPEDHTMDKKLVINVAPTGAFIKRHQNPKQPYTAEEIAPEVESAYKEGASVWHVHIRDTDGVPNNDPETVIRALDMDAVGKLISKIRGVDGVLSTETLIATALD